MMNHPHAARQHRCSLHPTGCAVSAWDRPQPSQGLWLERSCAITVYHYTGVESKLSPGPGEAVRFSAGSFLPVNSAFCKPMRQVGLCEVVWSSVSTLFFRSLFFSFSFFLSLSLSPWPCLSPRDLLTVLSGIIQRRMALNEVLRAREVSTAQHLSHGPPTHSSNRWRRKGLKTHRLLSSRPPAGHFTMTHTYTHTHIDR